MKRFLLTVFCLTVIFGTNAWAGLLVYDPGGLNSYISNAMADLGLAYDVRSSANPVTAADLTNYDALIIGSNFGGNMGGLDKNILEAGITGNIFITGHDLDWHTEFGVDTGTADPGDAVEGTATLVLDRAISFAQEKGGIGLVALGDFSGGFSYLPWITTATSGFGGDEEVGITTEGYASGIYDGLTGADMSGPVDPWIESYHNELLSFDPRFEVFENHYSVETPITIGYVVPVPAALLLGMLGLSVAGVKLRKYA